jgi:hypothetical protein
MYKKRQDMELFEEAVLLPETDKIEHKHDDGNIYTISKMIMKDYRTKDGYSHLTIVFTVLFNGKKIEAEVKYDSGTPTPNDTVEKVVENIRQSTGRDHSIGTSNLFGIELPTLTLLTPPSLNGLIDAYFWEIAPMFKEMS